MNNSTSGVPPSPEEASGFSSWASVHSPLLIAFAALFNHPTTRQWSNILFSGMASDTEVLRVLLTLILDFNPLACFADAIYLWWLIIAQFLWTKTTGARDSSSGSCLPELATAALVLRHAASDIEDWEALHTLTQSDEEKPVEQERVHEVDSLCQSNGLPKLHWWDHAGMVCTVMLVALLFFPGREDYVYFGLLAVFRLTSNITTYVLMWLSHSKYFSTSDKEYMLLSMRNMHRIKAADPVSVGAIWLLPNFLMFAFLVVRFGLDTWALSTLVHIFEASTWLTGLSAAFLALCVLPVYPMAFLLVAYVPASLLRYCNWPASASSSSLRLVIAISKLVTSFTDRVLTFTPEKHFDLIVKMAGRMFLGWLAWSWLPDWLPSLAGLLSDELRLPLTILSTSLIHFVMGFYLVLTAQAMSMQAKQFDFKRESVPGLSLMAYWTTFPMALMFVMYVFTFPRIPFTSSS